MGEGQTIYLYLLMYAKETRKVIQETDNSGYQEKGWELYGQQTGG